MRWQRSAAVAGNTAEPSTAAYRHPASSLEPERSSDERFVLYVAPEKSDVREGGGGRRECEWEAECEGEAEARGGSARGRREVRGASGMRLALAIDSASYHRVAIDPVCGMSVDPSSPLRWDYHGATYFFCNPGCRTKFQANPEFFLTPRDAAPPSMAELDAIYTCPMHPEVRQKGPGACPFCGMALEPAMVHWTTGQPRMIDMTRGSGSPPRWGFR